MKLLIYLYINKQLLRRERQFQEKLSLTLLKLRAWSLCKSYIFLIKDCFLVETEIQIEGTRADISF